MKKTKIFEICLMLSKEEFFNFETYLKTFTKATKQCLELYSFLKESYEKSNYKWSKASIEKERIEKKLYGQKTHNSTFATLRNDLLKYFEEYCAFLQFKEDKHHHLLRFFAKRSDEHYFRKVFNHTNRQLKDLQGLEILNTK